MKQYYKINEIAKLYNIGVDSLRYYEELGILQPKRGENRYRQYSTHDIYRLNIIKDMRNLGFSMAKIKTYLENRSIENSLLLFEEEIKVIDQKMAELQNMRFDMERRKEELLKTQKMTFDKIQVKKLPKRKCVTLKTTTNDANDNDFLLAKLSKEYEENLFAIANFNTGCIIDIHAHPCHYKDVLIMGDTLLSYEFELPQGTYLTLSYRGKKDQNFEHLYEMMAYMRKMGYEADGDALELLIIDVHETIDPKEYITQLQIKIKNADEKTPYCGNNRQ
ncbi:MerR family transcriptional regulator [Massilicoli timonensis]|uniref:MerR family transcriptional regulator n=1 Tax=Massilicoli timonensis TaxID=2015901 RepID=A0ABT1SHT7_9FIRM|nr:MerR family transcriptional regulator [Massilicoli timonensis]MCQ5120764.1 MerR family transcriptional regulator [Massilicoli timonensis]